MTILAVDDDEEDIEIFIEAIRDIDPSIFCLVARSAEEALRILNGDIELPTFIFLDINMPKIDGTTCLKELKKDKRFCHIRVIMYSTYNGEREIETYKQLGAAYLPKQNSYSELVSALQRLLRKRQ